VTLSRTLLLAGLALLTASPARAGFNWIGQVDADAQGLTSDDAKKRQDAIALLGQDDIRLAQSYLLTALADRDQNVRHNAAKALGNGAALAAVPMMVEWLSDPDAKTRAIAAEVLGDIGGPDATASLTRSLGDADDGVRQRAVKALGKIGTRGTTSVVIALIPRLEDSKSSVREGTIEQLALLGDKRAVIPLVARFDDTSAEAKKAAIRAIGRLGDRAAVPALVRKLSETDESVKMAAVGALGQLGAIEAIDTLVEQLTSGSDGYRAKVANALGEIAATPGAGKAGEDAMRTLVENLADANARAAARDALLVAGRAAVPALVAHLGGALKGDPKTAVGLLAEHGDARATSALTAELERGRVPVSFVLKALGATNDPAALVPVLAALANKDAGIRLAAMDALRPLLGDDARAGDVLVEHLADESLEVRVLAAEYVGSLKFAGATTKLVALTGSGNPMRLRRAAIDSLGEIGSPTATTALLSVLREGPAELHDAAATALAYLDDPGAIEPLVQLARVDRGPTRHELVRALGASLRGHADGKARALLRELADDGDVRVAVAAIDGLASAGEREDAEFLRTLLGRANAERARAAAYALGELHDAGAFDALVGELANKDDRLAGAAAWALGELVAAAPDEGHAATLVDRALYIAQHGTWAAAVDATAAIARMLAAMPPEARGRFLAGDRRQELARLALHHSRLVRANLTAALSALADDGANKQLAQLAHDDVSPHVRGAALRAIARFGRDKAVLATAADADPDRSVRELAKSLLASPPGPAPARNEWRTFYVVDRGAEDAPVRQEPYFVATSDGLVWASYTDARGDLTSEHIPPGDATVEPASRESEF
jgi:cellulose synthase operon protein C